MFRPSTILLLAWRMSYMNSVLDGGIATLFCPSTILLLSWRMSHMNAVLDGGTVTLFRPSTILLLSWRMSHMNAVLDGGTVTLFRPSTILLMSWRMSHMNFDLVMLWLFPPSLAYFAVIWISINIHFCIEKDLICCSNRHYHIEFLEVQMMQGII
jgi:hypothetical protein